MNRISSLFNFIANKLGNVSMGTTRHFRQSQPSSITSSQQGVVHGLLVRVLLRFRFRLLHPDIICGRCIRGQQTGTSRLCLPLVVDKSQSMPTMLQAQQSLEWSTDMRFTLTQTIFSRFKEIPNEQHYHSYIC